SVATATGAFANKNAGTGKTVNVTGITLGGQDAGNYTLQTSTASAQANITPATLSAVTGITAANKTYDGTTSATLTTSGAGFAGMISGDQLSVATATGAFANKNAGTGKTVNVTGITLGGQDAANYTLQTSTASAQADITPATLSAVTGITAASKTYDGTTAATLTTSGAGFTGMIAGDQLSVATATGAFANKNAGTSKPVSITGITLGGQDSANYTLATGTASTLAAIDPRLVATGALVVADKVYDGSTTAIVKEAQLQGVLAGDAVTVTVSAALAAFSDKGAGAGKTVNISGLGLAGADAGNYRLQDSSARALASITPRTLALGTLTVADRVYDGTTTATVSSGTLEGLLAGDVVALDLARAVAAFGDRNAGRDKPVAVSGLALGGADAPNYRLGATSGSARATISVRPSSTFSGAAGSNWSDPANWDVRPEGANVASVLLAPSAGASVTFDAAAPAVSLLDLTVGRTLVVAAPGLAAERVDNRAGIVLAAGVTWDLSRRTVTGAGTFTNRGNLTVVDGVLDNALLNEGGSVSVGGRSRLGPVTNAGRFGLQPGAVVTVAGAYRQTAGLTTLGAEGAPLPSLSVSAGSGVLIEAGELGGSGTIDGSLVVGAALVSPGFSPGELTVKGDLSLGPSSITLIEIGGTQAGSFDFLDVTGRASLDGTLRVASYGNFSPKGTEQFTFLRAGAGVAGSFSSFVNEDPLMAALPWSGILVATPSGVVSARPLATQEVDAVLGNVKPLAVPTQPVPTPPTLAAVTAAAAAATSGASPGGADGIASPGGSSGSASPGGPLDPLPNIITKAGNSSDEDERMRQAGDGVGPPAPAAATTTAEQPFVEDRPAQARGNVRSLEFEPAPAATTSNPATREVDRTARERAGNGC
ncbi:MAG: YDG domain-containing protein, partial [Rubrivivax sp.]